MYICPTDKLVFDVSRDAIVCWESHEPELFTTYSLAQIGRDVGNLSRERVRQIANSLDKVQRKRNYAGAVRGKVAEKHRMAQRNRSKKVNSA